MTGNAVDAVNARSSSRTERLINGCYGDFRFSCSSDYYATNDGDLHSIYCTPDASKSPVSLTKAPAPAGNAYPPGTLLVYRFSAWESCLGTQCRGWGVAGLGLRGWIADRGMLPVSARRNRRSCLVRVIPRRRSFMLPAVKSTLRSGDTGQFRARVIVYDHIMVLA